MLSKTHRKIFFLWQDGKILTQYGPVNSRRKSMHGSGFIQLLIALDFILFSLSWKKSDSSGSKGQKKADPDSQN